MSPDPRRQGTPGVSNKRRGNIVLISSTHSSNRNPDPNPNPNRNMYKLRSDEEGHVACELVKRIMIYCSICMGSLGEAEENNLQERNENEVDDQRDSLFRLSHMDDGAQVNAHIWQCNPVFMPPSSPSPRN